MLPEDADDAEDDQGHEVQHVVAEKNGAFKEFSLEFIFIEIRNLKFFLTLNVKRYFLTML